MQTTKFIDFIITKACTYNCSYCSQNKLQDKEKRNADRKTIDSFLNFLDKIENDFEITISGGEAILHPDFYYLINEIKQKNFKINLITNLSFPIEVYCGIFNILGKNLNRFDVSCHLEQIKDFEGFLDKFERFLHFKPKNTKTTLFIPIFKINNSRKEKIKQAIHIAKINEVEVEYQKIRFLKGYLEKNQKNDKEKLLKTYSRYCDSGFKSCVIYEDGFAYRCYGSRFSKSNFVGNINDYDFKLWKKPCVCSFKHCMCKKPIKYGQLKKEKSLPKALVRTFYDIFWLPFLVAKNKDILKTKFEQYRALKNNSSKNNSLKNSPKSKR